MTDALACRKVCLRYGAVPVLTDLDLTVAPGEVVALLGPSGSGKTTLLHAIAGFVAPAGGEIQLGGRTVSTPRRCVPPERRRVGMVFQNYALWPHLTVLDTVAYPMRRRGVGTAAARSRARELLTAVGLDDLAGRRPGELSGGQQQRVGLARALAAQPQVFLFDEPTAHLDAHLRGVVLAEVAGQRAAAGAAALYATHDAGEALAVAGRVAVLHGGRLAQVGTPEEVYARPADLTVARLTGPVSALAAAPVSAGVPDAWILVRPDWAGLGGDLPATVSAVRFAGPHTDYELATPGGDLLVRESGAPRVPVGSATTWTLRRSWPVATHMVKTPLGTDEHLALPSDT
jgi:ABC-type Fe3+/spermidine/putrescine transport system ATPase subunit